MNRISFLKKHPLTITWISTSWNLLYGIFLIFLFVTQSSWWYLALAGFFLTLGAGRFLAVSGRGRDCTVMRILAVMMTFLAVVIAGITHLTITGEINPVKNKILTIAQAAFVFGLIISAVINTILSHRKNQARMIMIRNLSLASALGAMLSLERTMLGTFGHQGAHFNMQMEAGTGMLVFILLLFLAYNLYRASQRIR